MPAPKKVTAPAPAIEIELVIRASASAIFEAFVEPKWLKKFWLSKASAPLELGKTIRWDFKVDGASDQVTVIELTPDQSIAVRWSDQTVTRWTLAAFTPKQTRVRIRHSGFKGSRDAILATLLDGTEGYTLVLADLKVLLEQGIQTNLVKDKAALIERSLAE